MYEKTYTTIWCFEILLVKRRGRGEGLWGAVLELPKLLGYSVWKMVLNGIETNQWAPQSPHLLVTSAHLV